MLMDIVCAIYTSDEEKCIATARQLMRDGATSDSYRMFALVSNLCQSPVSWYTSGPAQKYILRQIKAMDEVHGDTESSTGPERKKGSPLDACVLMLYGHILFTSTSYTYALGRRWSLPRRILTNSWIGYFLRSRALDPDNLMVNLSLGLAYVHYGLKRQSTNRQYLLLQGQSFLSHYAKLSSERLAEERNQSKAEAYYNIGRLYQLLGVNYLALEYYQRVEKILQEKKEQGNIPTKLTTIILSNKYILLTINKYNYKALSLIKESLII